MRRWYPIVSFSKINYSALGKNCNATHKTICLTCIIAIFPQYSLRLQQIPKLSLFINRGITFMFLKFWHQLMPNFINLHAILFYDKFFNATFLNKCIKCDCLLFVYDFYFTNVNFHCSLPRISNNFNFTAFKHFLWWHRLQDIWWWWYFRLIVLQKLWNVFNLK